MLIYIFLNKEHVKLSHCFFFGRGGSVLNQSHLFPHTLVLEKS